MSRSLFPCFVALAFLQTAAYGQVLYGSLVGNVPDPSSAAMPNAVVSIANPATGFSSETKTDSRGFYEFNNLLAGDYDVKITAQGFAVFEASRVGVSINTVRVSTLSSRSVV